MPDIRELLKNNDVEVRRDAVEQLRGKASAESVQLLLLSLEDISWRVRKTAVSIILDEYPPEDYIVGLIKLLYLENNAGARNSAIETLIKLKKKAIPFLIESFSTDNRDVRKFIIDIIGELKDTRTLKLMLDALGDEDDNVKVSAIEHLGKVGEPSVVDALIHILENEDLWTAYPAVDALGRIGDRNAVPVLLKALSRKPLREPVLRALGEISDPETIREIVPFLNDTSKAVQEDAIKALARMYHKGVSGEAITEEMKKAFGEKALDMVVRHAWGNKHEVRVSAIFLLGLIKDESALNPLFELSLEEDYEDDVKRAFVFIGKGNPESLLPLFDTDNPHKKRFICDVAAIVASPIYYDILSGLLNDYDGHVRAIAALGLANIGDLRAVQSIIELLSDTYEDVQEAAVKSLIKLKKGLVTAEIIDMLSDRDPVLRKNCSLLLGSIGAVEAVSALGFAMKDENTAVRVAVVKAFSLLMSLRPDECIRHLTFALTDEDSEIKASAALSLGAYGRSDALESLCLLLKDHDDTVRATAARALGLIRDKKAVDCLISILSDRNGFVVTSAIESLGRIGGDEAGGALLLMLDSQDKEIKRTAIKALSSFTGIEKQLLPHIRDEDWATRAAAVETLGTMITGAVRAELEKLLDTEEDPVVRKALEESLDV